MHGGVEEETRQGWFSFNFFSKKRIFSCFPPLKGRKDGDFTCHGRGILLCFFIVMRYSFLLSCFLLAAVLGPVAHAAIDKARLLRTLDSVDRTAELDAELKSLPKGTPSKDKQALQHALQDEKKRMQRIRQQVGQCADAVAKSGNINAKSPQNGLTLLMAVAESGSEEAVRMVLAENPDMMVITKKGKTALQMERENGGNVLTEVLTERWVDAVENNKMDEVVALLDIGFPASTSVNGNPPLGIAIKTGNKELFNQLSFNNPVVTDVMKDGTSLPELAIRANDADALLFLLQSGADATEPFSDGDDPLRFVLCHAKPECARAFIVGAKLPNEQEGTTLACMAVRYGSPEMVRRVLPIFSDAAAEDSFGNNPLLEAARRGRVDVLTAVREVCPSCAAENKQGETALMHAALSGKAEMVDAVRTAFPNLKPGKKDKKGRTAEDFARMIPNNPAQAALKAAQ